MSLLRSLRHALAALLMLLSVLLFSLQSAQAQSPGLVSWWPGNGNYTDVVSGNDGIPYSGVLFIPAVYNEGFFMNGIKARIFVPDVPSLAITGSLAITAWVWVATYPPSEPVSTILFRGDDRSGYDPYWFGINDQGKLWFQVDNDENQMASVISPKPIPLGKFIFVAATLDNTTGVMSLYENGILEDQIVTSIRPFADLDPSYDPGVGIGNIQSATYNDPFEGIIDDLKIYNVAQQQITPMKLHLSESTVQGGKSVTATLTLDDSPITALSVPLSSTLAAAKVPANVKVAAGRYSASFSIKTSEVTATKTGTISASLNGVNVSANLTVTP